MAMLIFVKYKVCMSICGIYFETIYLRQLNIKQGHFYKISDKHYGGGHVFPV